jgi:hypothetical protein
MDRDEVLATKRYLSNIGQWPRIPSAANPELWLDNFLPGDMDHALALLDSIVYFNSEQTEKLVCSAFHSMSATITSGCANYEDRRTTWVSFVQSLTVTYPTGETPNPTDSGHLFVRIFRDLVGFDEPNVKTPDQVVQAVYDGDSSPILLVDDFAGSGDQFVKTWRRECTLADGTKTTLEEVIRATGLQVYYVAAVATKKAMDRMQREAPEVRAHVAHVLTEVYGACDTNSVVFPAALRPTSADFVTRNSRRAGIPGHAELGFSRLGLAVGFEHSIPDASLPIIWYRGNPSWIPVLPRRAS